MAYLTRPTERLYCRFEHHGRNTVKLRYDLLHYCAESLKNPFFDVFFGPNHNFFLDKSAFFIFWRFWYSQTENYPVSLVLAERNIKNAERFSAATCEHQKNPISILFGPKRIFLPKNAFFNNDAPYNTNRKQSCKFEGQQSTAVRLQND